MPDTADQHLNIGEKLRSARKKAGMSLRELAENTDVSASMLSQIENGKTYPSVRSLYAIAAALSVSMDYFFPTDDSRDAAGTDPRAGGASGVTASEMRAAAIGGAADGILGEFLASPGGHAPVMHEAGRPTIELRGGVTWARLTASAEHGVEFLEITYEPGASSGASMSHHAGREFGLILAGELVVELGFDRHRLGAGDSIVFDSTTPHRLTNDSELPARAIWIVLDRQS